MNGTARPESDASTGELLAIWLKPARRLPMKEVSSVRADAGQGLEGNANRGGRRQVTIISAEAWADAEQELGQSVDPRSRRANLYVRGTDLRNSRGRILRVGGCRIEIRGETRPCKLMDDACDGLQKALDPDWRGGAYGVMLDDGEIAVGDPVVFE